MNKDEDRRIGMLIWPPMDCWTETYNRIRDVLGTKDSPRVIRIMTDHLALMRLEREEAMKIIGIILDSDSKLEELYESGR